MAGLPIMPAEDGIRKNTQIGFSGYDHRVQSGDGAIWDMINMSGDKSPILSPRKPRYKTQKLGRAGGFYTGDGFFWVDYGELHERDEGFICSDLMEGEKQFAALGDYVVIFPDKIYCVKKKSGGQGDMKWKKGTLNCAFNDELSADKFAVFHKENSIADTKYSVMELPDEYHEFRAGDGVSITVFSHSQIAGEINIEAIVRAVEGKYLIFYENTFLELVGDAEEITVNAAVYRNVPEMDFICENENRLWGCKGDTIYASKLGDPFNWNVFDGLSTDSFAVDAGSAGEFTACFSFMGYPVFFKEDQIYKVYGSQPANYQVINSLSLGVQAGSHRSLAVAGERLFYLSRSGVMCYSGGIPDNLSAAFGELSCHGGVGGSDGIKYYISMIDGDGNPGIFVYDTRYDLWHREDSTRAVAFGFYHGLYFLDDQGIIWETGKAAEIGIGWEKEKTVESMAEFSDFYEGGPNHLGTAKLQLRLEAEAGSRVEISMQFDSDGEWRLAAQLTPQQKRSYYLPIIPRRCDHFRLRIKAKGDWRLYSLTRESYTGSER